MKKKRNPVKESFGAFKLSKPTEQLLREVDEEERKIEERKWRDYKKRHPE